MQVKICPKCGHQNGPYFLECSKCHAPLSTVSVTEKTMIAKALRIIAIAIYIVGFIGGGLAGPVTESFAAILLVWISAAVSGTLMLGFSEVIRLLHEINTKRK